jgi:hypothetical protein
LVRTSVDSVVQKILEIIFAEFDPKIILILYRRKGIEESLITLDVEDEPSVEIKPNSIIIYPYPIVFSTEQMSELEKLRAEIRGAISPEKEEITKKQKLSPIEIQIRDIKLLEIEYERIEFSEYSEEIIPLSWYTYIYIGWADREMQLVLDLTGAVELPSFRTALQNKIQEYEGFETVNLLDPYYANIIHIIEEGPVYKRPKGYKTRIPTVPRKYFAPPTYRPPPKVSLKEFEGISDIGVKPKREKEEKV